MVCSCLSVLCFANDKKRRQKKNFLENLDETRKIWYDVLNYEKDKGNQLTAEDGGSFMLFKGKFLWRETGKLRFLQHK